MRQTLGEKMWNRSIHALRHGMADTLKQAGVSPEIIDDISGRLSEGSETNTRYTNPAKSGSPSERSTTSPPRARICLAALEIAHGRRGLDGGSPTAFESGAGHIVLVIPLSAVRSAILRSLNS